jgi:uncharacterized protein (UPF0332 family)
MEQLMAEGLYEAVVKRAYPAMLSAATAALRARDIQSGNRQAIVCEFNDVFVKTGLLDEKFYEYFHQAFSFRADSDDSSFATADYRQAQTTLLRGREFVTACRLLCD